MVEAQPPPVDIPSTSIPSPPPSPTSPSSNPPTPRISLPHILSSTNSKISRLNSILSTTSGLDTTLLTISYTLTLLTSTLPSLSSISIPSLLTPKPNHPPSHHPSALTQTLTSLRTFTTLTSDIRIFLRLFSLLSIHTWALSLLHTPSPDKVLRTIAWSQIFVNTIYQALENVAYLSSHGVLRLGDGKGGRREKRCWLWSSRFWAVHVGLEFGRLGREAVLMARASEAGKTEMKGDGGGAGGFGEKEGEVAVLRHDSGEGSEREVERWWRELGVNLAYAPLVVHWSLEKGCVGEGWVGSLGSFAGVLGFREVWRRAG